MSKRNQGSATTKFGGKRLTSSASALVAALTVLTASLRVTQGAPVPDVNPGAKSPANPLRVKVADNKNKGNSANSLGNTFITTTKDKEESYTARGPKPISPSGGSTSHGPGGHK